MTNLAYDLDELNRAMAAYFEPAPRTAFQSACSFASDDVLIPSVLAHLVKSGYKNNRPTFLDDNGKLIEGVYANVPNDVYHDLDAISSSQVKCYVDSPKKYERNYVDKNGRLFNKKSRETGTLTHEIVLEGVDVFNSRRFTLLDVADYPNDLKSLADLKSACVKHGLQVSGTISELSRRLHVAGVSDMPFETRQLEWIKANIGIDCYDACIEALDFNITCSAIIKLLDETPELAQKALKLPVSREMQLDVIALDEAVKSNTYATKFLDRKLGMPEVMFISKDHETGLMLKCKVDWLVVLKGIIVPCDLKTTRSANPYLASYQFADLRYDLQAAFYLKVIKPHLRANEFTERLFPLITVETGDCNICEVFELHDDDWNIAETELPTIIKNMQNSISKQSYLGYTEKGKSVIKLARRKSALSAIR
ncbi:PD-(D/E)XK nuclease-like domain-containing protein [Shewanella baltica]|uniref:PD-(D/E)XK nuclease-like domain-containing protein n=1 Tax=Shewanella baltica TaxID=62322 RepID=UPI0002112D74|nr:PD-(D/E)XK nuclease-like domain-containing protein [Shewanella baltica]AEH16203.1 hypothetical protein Sbal117_4565 [Shewanella baltica OS117]